MTYNVFGGTLSLPQSVSHVQDPLQLVRHNSCVREQCIAIVYLTGHERVDWSDTTVVSAEAHDLLAVCHQ